MAKKLDFGVFVSYRAKEMKKCSWGVQQLTGDKISSSVLRLSK